MDVDDWLSIYKSAGCALIPCEIGKKEPALPEWSPYQRKPPTDEELKKWFKEGRKKNFAVVCGEASNNLIVLDFDYPEIFEKFFDKEKIKQTWVVKTPHGYHVYFRNIGKPIEGFDIPKCVEVRSTGRYVIAPPSFFLDHDAKSLEYKFLSRPTQIQEVSNLEEAIIKRATELGMYSERKIDETKWLNLTFGYTGDEPPCIKQLVKNLAPIGERDERALRIACYYANFCNDTNKAREKLLRWYDNCEQNTTEPFNLKDALGKIDIARKGGYIFGCSDLLLSKYCSPCPLGESKYVEQILKSPDILGYIKTLLDDVIAGEDANKQLIFLLLLSGKVSDPDRKQIVLLQGEAGGGKTTLANNISKLFRTKKIGRFTKHALDYSDLEGYEVLYIQEIGALDKEDQGISTLKFLSSDDKGYTIEATVRDPETGEWVTMQRRIPPITVITTTTRIDVDPQFSRRSWLLNVDETVTQTKKIKNFKIDGVIENTLVSLGFKKERKKQRALRVLKKLVASLRDCKIAILFPESIANLLGESRKIRIRGDYDKFTELAWLTGFLHQSKATPLPSNPGNAPVYLAPAQEIASMFKITKDPLIAMTTDLEKRFLDLFNAMDEEGYMLTEAVFTKNERAELAQRLGKTPGTITKYFRELAKRCPYVLKVASGREVHYTITKNLDDLKHEILENTYFLESPISLALKFLEESEKRLESIRALLPSGDASEKFLQATRESLEKEKIKLEQEKKLENIADSESLQLADFPKENNLKKGSVEEVA